MPAALDIVGAHGADKELNCQDTLFVLTMSAPCALLFKAAGSC